MLHATVDVSGVLALESYIVMATAYVSGVLALESYIVMATADESGVLALESGYRHRDIDGLNNPAVWVRWVRWVRWVQQSRKEVN